MTRKGGRVLIAPPQLSRLLGARASTSAVASNPAKAIVISPDGAQIAAGGSDGRIRLYNVAERRRVQEIQLTSRSLLEMVYTPDGSLLAGDRDGQLSLFDTVTGKVVRTYEPGAPISVMAIVPGGEQLIAGSDNGYLCRLSLTTGESQRIAQLPAAVTAASVSPDGRYVAAAAADRFVRVWALDAPGEPFTFRESAVPTSLQFLPDGRRLLGGVSRSAVTMWTFDPSVGLNVEKRFVGAPGVHIIVPGRGATFLSIGARGSQVAISRGDSASNDARIQMHAVSSGTIRDLALSPDQATLATLMHDGRIELLQLDAAAMTVMHRATISAD